MSSPNYEFGPLEVAVNYRQKLVEEFASSLRGDVLEIGAGIGQITQLLVQRAGIARVTAVEPDADYAASLCKRVPQAEVVIGSSIAVGTGRAFDAVICINVLEHVEDDAGELRRQHDFLRERGGHLCLFVPARQELYACMDQDFGHLRRYSRSGLRALVEAAGFEILTLRYYNLFGYFGWWLSFRLLRKRQFDTASVAIFDRLIFPWSNWLERHVCAPPLGQSLLLVARPRA